ncbi:MAG: hypothetical protein JWQ01_48 [Massilia sp.]|nr:hypothetical protein [Massilia sp.]
MGTQNAGAGSHPGDASVGVGRGNDRDGLGGDQDGSQRDSGGSGGPQMTRSLEDTHSDAPSAPHDMAPSEGEAEAAGTAATATTRGPVDTHSHQGGPGKTGLGVPETGGNQGPGDMAPPSNT